jgi:uncharacterized membrane protein
MVILQIIITTILIVIAAICNAICDRLENKVSFNGSIFYKKDITFWCKELSWNRAKRIFGYKIDAWHLFKSVWICALLLAVCINICFFNDVMPEFLNLLIIFIASGTIWNVTFNIFYNRILKRHGN